MLIRMFNSLIDSSQFIWVTNYGPNCFLYVQRVKAHCIACEEMQRIFGSSSSRSIHIKLTTSNDTAETILDEQEPHQCSICMESFEHNDLVSWSPSTECEHVFHHACIKTWLLHHECCPYCRVCLLSVDKRNIDIGQSPAQSRGVSLGIRGGNKNKKRKNWGNDRLKELAVQRHQRILSTYFCLKEGLVTLEQPMNVCLCDVKSTAAMESNSTSDTKSIRTTELSKSTLRQFFASDVQPNEMMALRTHPKSIRSTSDVVVTITAPTVQNVGTEASMDGYDDATMLAHDTVDSSRAANAIMDIETTMKELPVLSDNATDRNDTV